MSASQTTAPPAFRRTAPPRGHRPDLRLVALGPARTPRVPFVLLVVLLLAGGFVGLLLVNTSLQQGAFLEHDLERETAALSERHQALSESLAVLESPGSLAARASALGMVPMTTPVFLRLPDGRVLGTPTPAKAGTAAARQAPSVSDLPGYLEASTVDAGTPAARRLDRTDQERARAARTAGTPLPLLAPPAPRPTAAPSPSAGPSTTPPARPTPRATR